MFSMNIFCLPRRRNSVGSGRRLPKRFHIGVFGCPDATRTALIRRLYLVAGKAGFNQRSTGVIQNQRHFIWDFIVKSFEPLVVKLKPNIASQYGKLIKKDWKNPSARGDRTLIFQTIRELPAIPTFKEEMNKIIAGMDAHVKPMFADWSNAKMNRIFDDQYTPTIEDCVYVTHPGLNLKEYETTQRIRCPDLNGAEHMEDMTFVFIDRGDQMSPEDFNYGDDGNSKSALLVAPFDQIPDDWRETLGCANLIAQNSGNLRIDVFIDDRENYQKNVNELYRTRIQNLQAFIKLEKKNGNYHETKLETASFDFFKKYLNQLIQKY